MPRRFPIFQRPNRPLILAALAGAAARAIGAPRSRRAPPSSGLARTRSLHLALRLTSHLALFVWGVEEVTTGANWFRRLLGLGGGGYAVSRLLLLVGSRGGRASVP